MNEAQYKSAWQQLEAPSLVELAVSGGALADRLSFVFCAAYQCAVRHCFMSYFKDLDPHAWYCLAASEDRTGTLPGVTVNGNVVNGNKTWIAAAAVVDKLIVTAHGETLLIDREASGVTIDEGTKPGFLPDMTQGKASFSNTPIESRLPAPGNFPFAEGFYTLCASAGYLGRWQPAETRGVIDALADIDPAAPDRETLISLHETVKTIGRTVAATVSEPQARADFEQNGRLIGMYGRVFRDRSG